MWPRYRKNSTSTEVSRASHTHQAPHIGLPQMLPVSRHSAVKPAPTGPISAAARSASGWRQTSDSTEQSARAKYPADASQAAGTCTYMMRTASPCCQSAGAKNRPQTRPTAVSAAPAPASHGSTAPDRRRKRPGLAKRCRERPGFRPLGRGMTELASTRINLAHAGCRLKADAAANWPAFNPTPGNMPPFTIAGPVPLTAAGHSAQEEAGPWPHDGFLSSVPV